jgi:esterase/lipase superfamily enzyme
MVRTLLVAACAGATAWTGVASAQKIESVHLRGPHAPAGVRTEVLLPEGWQPGRPALLMVFLHDGLGSEKSFRKHGLAFLAEGLMRGGVLPPVVIASPRYRGTFMIDSPRGATESFVADDLVPALERAFPGAGGAREKRSIWGISLGGYGALKMALRHPRVFGRVAALAPWVQHLSWDDYARHRGLLGRWLMEPVFGHSRDESRFEDNDLYRIAALADPSEVPPLYIRTGSRDRWEAGALALIAELRERGVPVDAVSIPGAAHDWGDWFKATPGVLRFLTHRQAR